MTPKVPASKLTARRSHLQLREKPSQAEPYWPVKMKIQDSLDFARFESRFDLGGCRVNNLCRH